MPFFVMKRRFLLLILHCASKKCKILIEVKKYGKDKRRNQMKKRYLLAVVILLFAFNINAFASEETPQRNVNECLDVAIEIIEEYLMTVNESQEFYTTIDTDITSDLQEYLNVKSIVDSYIIEKINGEKENYMISYKLLNSFQDKNKVFLDILITATFNYMDLSDVESGYSKLSRVEFTIVDDEYILSDWFTEFDTFDEKIRVSSRARNLSEITLNDFNGIDSINSSLYDDVKIEIISYFENDEHILTEQDFALGVESKNVVQARAALINRTNVKNYALNYAKSSAPSSGRSGVYYYDFSQISGNWDCTNFVSHCLLAGGATPYKQSSGNGWYYNSLSDRSASWSGVPNLYNFLTTNTTKGPSGWGNSYALFNPNSNYPCNEGDIIQFYNGSVWRHSSIVTGWYMNGSLMGALATGRSGVGQYNYNQKAEEIYAGYSKRCIVLSYNY